MIHETRNLVTDWQKGDGERLFQMEVESSSAWPGGEARQTSAEEEERFIRESDLLGAFVTEEKDRIISICTVRAKPGQKWQAYVPYLNCLPDYHGKKYGKSALLAAVECAYDAGYKVIDIHTWPANKKSVPLYKKMGFMWQPDSSVHLENFTPLARNNSVGKAYFSKHDWYQTLARSYELKEDLVMRGKVRVYEYLWRAESGDFLRMVFDRQSWGIVEIENNDFMISCSLPDEKLVAGVPHIARWKVVNKKRTPASVFIAVSGDPGIDIHLQETRVVNDSALFETSFVIDPEIPEKKQDPKAAIIKTDLVIDGLSVELAAGVQVRQAVDVSVEPSPRSVLIADGRRSALVTLRSNLDTKATAKISFAPKSGVNVLKQKHSVLLNPKDGAELLVPLSMPGPGPVVLDAIANVVISGKTVPGKRKRLDLLAVERGGIEGCVGEDYAYLCGGGLMLFADLRTGNIVVYHTVRAKKADRIRLRSPRLGPPFSWADFFQEKAEASFERDGIAVCLRLRSGSILRSGVILERKISLGQSPLIRVEDTIINGSGTSVDLSLAQPMSIRMGHDAETVIPRKQGIYRCAKGTAERNLDMLRLSEDGNLWPETWMCFQHTNGFAVGVIWHQAEKVEPGHWCSIQQKVGPLPPGHCRTLDPAFVFIGDGNWQTVQGWWRILIDDDISETEDKRPTTRRSIEIGIEPKPVLIAGHPGEAALSLSSIGRHKHDGKIRLKTPSGVKTNSPIVDVTGLCESTPAIHKVQFSASKPEISGSKFIDISFETSEAIYHRTCGVLVLDQNQSDVSVSRVDEGKALVLDNGLLKVKVAPGFLGTVVSIEKNGKEYLNCPYPETTTWSWSNPWFGGISPQCGHLWGILHKERFRHSVVRKKGKRGLLWHGVRVSSRFKQEKARGFSMSLDYLLTRGADVLAIILRIKNELNISTHGQAGFVVFPSFAASPGSATFWNPGDQKTTALSAPHWASAGYWQWGGVVSKAGRSLYLSANGKECLAGGESEGSDGCILGGQIEGSLRPMGALEGLFFLVPGNKKTASTHEVWSEFDTLP